MPRLRRCAVGRAQRGGNAVPPPYYANGSHAGFILYVTDPAQHEKDIEAMRDQLIKSKGMGNFKNLFYYALNGKADDI